MDACIITQAKKDTHTHTHTHTHIHTYIYIYIYFLPLLSVSEPQAGGRGAYRLLVPKGVVSSCVLDPVRDVHVDRDACHPRRFHAHRLHLHLARGVEAGWDKGQHEVGQVSKTLVLLFVYMCIYPHFWLTCSPPISSSRSRFGGWLG